MELSFTFRNTPSSEVIKEYVEKRVDGLRRLVREPATCHVVFSHERFRYSAEVIVEAPRAKFRSKEDSSDMNSAFDTALDAIRSQLRKYRDRRKSL